MRKILFASFISVLIPFLLSAQNQKTGNYFQNELVEDLQNMELPSQFNINSLSGAKIPATKSSHSTHSQESNTVSFTCDVRYGQIPLDVNFTNTTEGNYNQILWNFGDGYTSSDKNPSHIYNQSGEYDVSLVIHSGDATDSVVYKKLLTVYTLPTNDTLDINIILGDSVRLIIQHKPPFNVAAITKRTSWGPTYDPIDVKVDSIRVNPESNGLWVYSKFLMDKDATVDKIYFKNFALIYWSNGYNNMAEYNYNYRIHAVGDYVLGNKLLANIDEFYKVYPNPADEYFTIEFTTNIVSETSVTIVNEIGETVYLSRKIPTYSNIIKINTEEWVKGLYFVIVQNKKTTWHKKVLIR